MPGVGEEAILLTAGNRDPWVPFTRGALLDARITALQARIDSIPHALVLRVALDRLRADLAQLIAARDAMPPAEKALQAVVANPYGPPATLFTSMDKGGRALVTVDHHFFSKGDPKDSVRLITVYWTWERQNPAEAALIEHFRASFDIEALREMLTKD
jgi:hypothetical protein